MADETSFNERHLEELGLSPHFEIQEAQAVLRGITDRLEQEHARQRAIKSQRKEKREETDAVRGGRVVADHDDEDDEDELIRMHQTQFNYWRRTPRR